MAYLKYSSSLALLALVLIATASLPNCHAQLFPGFPINIPGLPLPGQTPPTNFPGLPINLPGLPINLPGQTPPTNLPGLPINLPGLPINLPGLTPPTNLPMSMSVAILGTLRCNVTLPTARPVGVDVTLSCDGGNTSLASAQTGPGGIFSIFSSGANAMAVNPTNCSVFVNTPVAGCINLNAGQAVRAPISLARMFVVPILGRITTFVTGAPEIVTVMRN